VKSAIAIWNRLVNGEEKTEKEEMARNDTNPGKKEEDLIEKEKKKKKKTKREEEDRDS